MPSDFVTFDWPTCLFLLEDCLGLTKENMSFLHTVMSSAKSGNYGRMRQVLGSRNVIQVKYVFHINSNQIGVLFCSQ